jgi:5-methyltetrahydropteroyltriglutamate--homocysteine methyltransferase
MVIPTEPIGSLPRPSELNGALLAERYTRVQVPGHSRVGIIKALSLEHETEVRRCLKMGARGAQSDFTEGPSAVNPDQTGGVVQLHARNFRSARPGARVRPRVLKTVRDHLKPRQRIFVGLVNPIAPRLEAAAKIGGRIVEVVKFIPAEQPGTTDDCGFSPSSDDTLTMRDAAPEKIRARPLGAIGGH